MDKGGESDKTSGAAEVRAVDERKPPVADKSGGASDKPAMVKSGGTSDRPSATAVGRMVDRRGTTGDGGPEVKDRNGNNSDMPPDEVDDGAVSEGHNKIFRLEGAVYSIGK